MSLSLVMLNPEAGSDNVGEVDEMDAAKRPAPAIGSLPSSMRSLEKTNVGLSVLSEFGSPATTTGVTASLIWFVEARKLISKQFVRPLYASILKLPLIFPAKADETAETRSSNPQEGQYSISIM